MPERVISRRVVMRRVVVNETKKKDGNISTVIRKEIIQEEPSPIWQEIITSFPFRLFMIEIPILLFFTILVASSSFLYMYTTNFRPYIKTVTWNPDSERARSEQVLPPIHCDKVDFESGIVLTTNSSKELFVDSNMPLYDAVDKVMTHGGAVFRNLITKNDASTLREYLISVDIESKSSWLKPKKERLPVIAQSQRRSFPLTPFDHPILPEILQGIASKKILESTLEQVLGPNPALVALSTMIPEKGAPNQNFHLDKRHDGSHMQYPATFAPNYALLIQLQDTTPEMGATSICPGTHYCATVANVTGETDTICEQLGFPVQDEDDGKWKAGDGLLYNGQVRHRGSANDSGPARVALILTFSSRWETSSKRILPLGALFALQRNMWGFTYQDLKDPYKFMKHSWLRSYGIWKGKDAPDWGWDYVRLTLHRIANDEYLVTVLDKLEKAGHAWWIELLGWEGVEIPSEAGSEQYAPLEYMFYMSSKRLRDISMSLWIISCLGYLGFVVSSSSTIDFREKKSSIIARVLIFHTFVAALFGILLYQMDQNTYWKTIRTSTSNWSKPIRSLIITQSSILPTSPIEKLVAPQVQDVLISSRLTSDDKSHISAIGSQANILDYHVGNRLLRLNIMNAVKNMNGKEQQDGMIIKNLTTRRREELYTVPNAPPRFLRQVQNGWIEMNDKQRDEWLREKLKNIIAASADGG